MKRLIYMIFCILFALASSGCVNSQRQQKEKFDHRVQIKLIPRETTIENGTVTMSGNLQVTNLFDIPLEKVVARVEQADDLVVSPSFGKIGNVGALASVLVEEKVTVSYPAPSQDTLTPKRRLKWGVDYVKLQKPKEDHPAKTILDISTEKPKGRHTLPGLRISEIVFYPKKQLVEY